MSLLSSHLCSISLRSSELRELVKLHANISDENEEPLTYDEVLVVKVTPLLLHAPCYHNCMVHTQCLCRSFSYCSATFFHVDLAPNTGPYVEVWLKDK